MAGRIPQHFINDLLARVDIVDIVDSRVKLKKKGKNHSACCPFHNEKTPSFSVSQDKQFYHCFGCGAHGNAISFIMEFDRLDFVEAIEELAATLGLEVPREQTSYGSSNHSSSANTQQKHDLYELMGSIAQFYRSQLAEPHNQHAIKYLKARGLSKEVVQKFGIGYVPDEWDCLRNKFGRKEAMVTTGMLVENESGNRYDRFRGRVMFPIHDRRGRVIGFGGRILGDGTPKYLNSPETPIFHKGKELYGLYEVLQTHRRPDQILVVEGYMDVVALAQYGVDYSVASLGTSTTNEHLQLLFRQTDTVICCYDGDQAGREAAWRALENALSCLRSGNILKFLFLPDGEDPDSYIRQHGKEAFEKEIRHATPLSEYLFTNLTNRVEVGSHEGKAALSALAKPLIEKIPDEHLQAQLNKILGQKTGLFLEHQVSIKKAAKTKQLHVPQKIAKTPMRVVIALLMQNPSYIEYTPDLNSVRDIAIPGLSLLLEVLDKCRANPHVTTGQLLEYWRNDKNGSLLSRLAGWEIPLSQGEDNDLTIFLDSLDKIIYQCIEKQIEALQAKERSVGLSTEEKRELLALMLDLKA